jgi:hypothetical protein
MPTAIRLTTMPGTIRKGRHFDALVLDLFGPSLGQEDISIGKPGEVAPAVCAFGERIRAAHPDASFKINVTVRKGQRKPPGYDAAEAAGDFNDRAFMRLETEDGKPIDAPTSAKAVA